MSPEHGFVPADELVHDADPADPSWNESWFFSWIDLAGGPSGFLRVGVMPNQRRAMLWCFLHVDGAWLAVEESRLHVDDLDLTQGIAYDRWALRFDWQADRPLRGARFSFEGAFRARSGPATGAVVPVSVDLSGEATGACLGTGTGRDGEDAGRYPASRFEQSLVVSGTAVVEGEVHSVRGGGHRDRSWGPRTWRQPYTLGDLQAEDRQLYFVGLRPGYGMAYLREGERELRHLQWAGGEVSYDDAGRTITAARLELVDGDGAQVDVELEPVGPSVCFDMGHTCEPPEHWLYWRTMVQARISGWPATSRGWFEANRYGC
jgi:hypothetical protein